MRILMRMLNKGKQPNRYTDKQTQQQLLMIMGLLTSELLP